MPDWLIYWLMTAIVAAFYWWCGHDSGYDKGYEDGKNAYEWKRTKLEDTDVL